jgi:NhaP-type Na+/H+ and K+/H+ antiporter
MLTGSEGAGGIYFNGTALSQLIGAIDLVFILFSGVTVDRKITLLAG